VSEGRANWSSFAATARTAEKAESDAILPYHVLARWNRFQSSIGVRFPDDLTEDRYRSFLTDRVFKVVQLSLALAILCFAILGIGDLTAPGAIQSTRFRYMIACPLLASILALSFTQVGRRYWSELMLIFAAAGTLCIHRQLVLLDSETEFKLTGGWPTVTYSLVFAFVALFPGRLIYTVLIGLMVQAVHIHLLTLAPQMPQSVEGGYCLNLACIFAIVCTISYARERLLRREFIHQQTVLDEKDEMKTQLLSFVSLEAIERAKSSGRAVADAFGEVTVVFCDIVGFTQLAERLAPKHLVEVLNDVFSALDQLAVSCKVEKVKTIGDAYMAIAGVADQERNSAEDAAEFALQAQAMTSAMAAEVGHPLAFRIGIHTGSLIGGVVGRQKMAYDYWGKTVNIASRLESTGVPEKIHVSGATYWRLNTRYDLEPRGNIELKGIGPVETYFLVGRKSPHPDGRG
jgi:adenylate cyclase